MVQATGGSGGLPSSFGNDTSGAQLAGLNMDSNWPTIIHALVSCGAFVLLMPIGAFLLRVEPRSVLWHWIHQSVATVLAVAGGGAGVGISTLFNKSKGFNAPHQLLGIVIIFLALVQWYLGYWHHHLYRRIKKPTKYGVVHRYFGSAVIFLAIINAGIGLSWSYASSRIIIIYSVAVLVICVPVIVSIIWAKRRMTVRKKTQDSRDLGVQPIGYESDIRLTTYADGRRWPADW
jgi:hypothetical protein